jgi:hypothetical protein
MTDVTPSVETPADSTPTPPAGNLDASAASAPASDPTPETQADSETISLDEAKKLRSEAANLRKRLKSFEENETKRKEAELSETERERAAREAAERERDEARNEARALRIDNAITNAVSDAKLNARDTAVVAQLVNRDALDIVDGKVTGIDAEIKRIKTNHAALFYGSTADGAAQGSNGVFDMNSIIRQKAGRA